MPPISRGFLFTYRPSLARSCNPMEQLSCARHQSISLLFSPSSPSQITAISSYFYWLLSSFLINKGTALSLGGALVFPG